MENNVVSFLPSNLFPMVVLPVLFLSCSGSELASYVLLFDIDSSTLFLCHFFFVSSFPSFHPAFSPFILLVSCCCSSNMKNLPTLETSIHFPYLCVLGSSEGTEVYILGRHPVHTAKKENFKFIC